MKKTSLKTRKKQLRAIVGTSLAGASMLQLAVPLMANAQVVAGTIISNTATATYDDGLGTTVNATSNTVEVTVAEVAGLTNVPSGVDDPNGGSFENNDTLYFKFTIKNTGNDPTTVYIPDQADLIALDVLKPNTLQGITPTAVEYSIDNGTTWIVVPVNNLTSLIAPGQEFLVRVTGTVTASTAGAPIRVTLGDTGNNDNDNIATQNQPDAPDTDAYELRTVDGANGATVTYNTVLYTEQTGAPINGEREASAFQQVALATQAKNLALTTVKKTGSITDTGATTAGNDDVVTFGLSLEVENTSPDATFTPEDLKGTPIQLGSNATGANAASADRILLSDVIPTGTIFEGTTPVAPAGWIPVYSYDDPATTIPVISSAGGALTAAKWTTVVPTNTPADANYKGKVKRIGFILNPAAENYGTANDGIIPKGTSITGFSFKVITSGLQANGGTIYNVAQSFGATNGDPTNEVVYDESGDNNPNNFNDNGTPPDGTGTNFDPAVNTGIPDADLDNNGTEDNVDTNGNNTGTGTEGEVIKIVVTGTVVSNDDILNGPNGVPATVGPNNDNDDFTNATTSVTAGVQEGQTFNPAPKVINNTVGIPATNPLPVNNVTIEPIGPSQANTATGTTGLYGVNADIPDGTVVTITYDPPGPAGPVSAVYTYDQASGTFDLTSGTPINVGTLAPGATANYTVTIDLPGGVDPLTDVSIPIIAFSDDGNRQTSNTDPTEIPTGTGPAFTAESVNNVTIDRLYTGFMRLVKEARILNADGSVKAGYSQTPTAQLAPGEFIEYRITYTNISEPALGSNVILNANNFEILEDGSKVDVASTGADNNWAANTVHQQNTVVGGVGTGSTVKYYSGAYTTDTAGLIGSADPADDSTVGSYKNVVGTVAPGISGTFKFRRQLPVLP